MCVLWTLLQIILMQFIVWIHILYVFICNMNSQIIWIHLFVWSLYFSYTGTTNQKKELFVMAVSTPTEKTFPSNFMIIPSAKKWVLHTINCLVFFSLHGEHICLLNWLVITNEENADYHSFETLILTHELFQSSYVMLCALHAIWQPFKKAIYHLLPSKTITKWKVDRTNWGW